MTVYVDDARIPAQVGRITGRWSHLVTDNPDLSELHAFASEIGLRRRWFQTGRSAWRPHYDLTDTKRQAAIQAGALPISYRDTPAVLARARRSNTTTKPATHTGN